MLGVMKRATLPIVPLHLFIQGQTAETFALLSDRTLGQTREYKPYYTCRFRDRYRSAVLMVWADSPWFSECETTWKVGQAYRLVVTFAWHEKFGPQIELVRLRTVIAEDRNEGYDLANLVDSSRFSIPGMWAELQQLIAGQIEREPVRRLVQSIYAKYAQRLQELPASDGKFHPFRGGWLEHILSLTRTCIGLVDHYQVQYQSVEQKLDRDLVLAGALLHDIGRVLEFRVDPLGNIEQHTVPGRLLGHMILGRDLVRQAATDQGNLPGDFLERLEHLILSHLALPEWGSPRLPLIPEVLILHHADDLDAKMEMYMRCLDRDQFEGPFTARDPVLGKSLLKPGAWPEDRVS